VELHTKTAGERIGQDRAVRSALRWEAVTVGCTAAEAAVSIGAGVAAGSLLLVAFGADSVVELISALVLFWRLWREARGRHADKSLLEAREQRAARIGGYLLYALSLYVMAQAVYGLLHHHQAEQSWLGLAVAVVAAIGMPLLARVKLRLADRIGSRALRADAMETLTCGYLAWVLLAGLAANALLRWWWLDSAASLLIVPLLLREAREATSGAGCCGDCH
jgi:divalent metal cation (Fe/Co/Zn/Cd) transporter